MITFGSLFAGIGGFDLGFERAGMVCKWQVEIDDYRQKILKQWWPDATQWDDIRTFEPTHVDVVCGGFPCQDISNAGKRKGIDGERSVLWSEYARIVRTIRPRFVVIENVSALLVRGFERVLGDLAALGYDAEWECIPASAFGAYHERERVFIVAYVQGEYGNARRLLEASEEWRTQLEFRRLRSMVDATERRERNIRFEHEPRVARMVDGVPNRTHRLEGLGNAVVPQVAEWIGKQIVEAWK
jgi:DNA (cytosine-5)-methyltransferase 1